MNEEFIPQPIAPLRNIGIACGQEMPQMRLDGRPIEINSVLNGYIVKCGCKTLVFEDKTKMLREISRYLDNPMQVEKEYLSKKG